MVAPFLLQTGQQLLVRRLVQGGTDTHGNPQSTYSDPQPLPIYAMAPTSSEEQQALGRDWATSSTWSIYAPAGTVVSAYDRVILPDGTECEVIGQPRPWSQTGFADLLQVGGVHLIIQKKAG